MDKETIINTNTSAAVVTDQLWFARTILHCDLNNFFASVECLYDPALKGVTMAVGGSIEDRHGIILAKNEAAKRYGVKTAQTIGEAKSLCPGLVIVPPHYEKYLKFSRAVRKIFLDYTPLVEPFGIDEAWLDITHCASSYGGGKALADIIRERVKFELGITLSVGVSFNKVFAKLGSDMKKPDGTTVIGASEFRDKIWGLPAQDLLCVGRSTQKKLNKCGIYTIGEIAQSGRIFMEKIFGKCGGVLWEYANGMECSPVSEYGVFSDVKSVGNSSTSPFDITSPEAARALIMVLCESVGTRLREHGMRCGNVAVSARTKTLVTSEKSEKLKSPILSTRALYENAVRIFEGWYDWKEPIRSIGVRAQSLSVGTGTQISLFEDEYSAEEIDRVIDSLGRRFGYGTVTRGRAMLHRIRERPPLAFGAASRGAHDPTLPPAEIEVC